MIPATHRAVMEIGGRRFDSWRGEPMFKRVEVRLNSRNTSEAELEIFDPHFAYVDRWRGGDGIQELSAKVWLSLGNDLPTEPAFEGQLAGAEWLPESTTFLFFDHGYRMRKVKQTEYHRNLDDLQIIEKLARQNGLSFEGPQPPIRPGLDKHKSVIQDAQTDWEHAEERANDAGVVLYVRGQTLYAKEAAKTAAPVLSLKYKEDFRLLEGASFRYRAPENQEGRPSQVETRGRGRGGKRITGKSDTNERGRRHVEIKNDLPIKSKRHADRRAQARKDIQREHAFTGTIVLLPRFEGVLPDIRSTVEVMNVGKLFSGKYICESVSHLFAAGTIETTLQLYRDIRGA